MTGLPPYWWSRNADEILWLEISDREDFGTDLTHYVDRADGSLMPSYRLARDEVNLSDIVFHYDLAWDGIRSWSRVAGPFQEWDEAWEIELDGPYRLQRAVTYKRLFEAGLPIERILKGLPISREESRHLPFIFDSKGLRLAQTYLAKLPRRITEIFPQLAEPLEK